MPPEERPEIDGCSIVLRGAFNPKLLQPAWLAREALIAEAEADGANISVISNDVTAFSLGEAARPWVNLQVTDSQFSVATASEHALVARDLVIGIFGLLSHTPVSALGINRDLHFVIANDDEWHRIGHTLAPKEIWRPMMTGHIGLRSLTVENQREGLSKLNVKVEPSLRLNPRRGVYFQINDHYEPEGATLPMLVLRIKDSWNDIQTGALAIAKGVLQACRSESASAR